MMDLVITQPAALGLDGKTDKTKAYVQCPDACQYTGGGTVIYEISRVSGIAD